MLPLRRMYSFAVKSRCSHLAALTAQMEGADALQSPKRMAWGYYRQVFPRMEALRRDVDALENLVPKDLWPMPTYGDLLFEV